MATEKTEFPVPSKTLMMLFSATYLALCTAGGLNLAPGLNAFTVQLLVVLLIVTALRQLGLLYLSLRDVSAPPVSQTTPRVSVIMPAFNEGAVIEDAMRSLARLTYPPLEIIVVDDGSTDDTAAKARRVAEQEKHANIQVIVQGNGGKAAALNTGIIHASGDYILAVDADSRLDPDTVQYGLRHFSDPRVAAVGGFVAVANAAPMLARFQELEYMLSLNFVRRALSGLGAVTVVPGPVGMFRKEALMQVGGYANGVFAEDADLTVRLLTAGWRVKGDRRMVSWTEVPETFFSLLRQRYRWRRGLYQAFAKNAYALFTSPGVRGVAVGLFLAAEAFALEVANLGITLFFLMHFFRFGEVALFASWYLAVIALDVSILWFVCRGTDRRYFYCLALFLIQRFSYVFLLQAWGGMALLDEWLDSKMSWDKLERLGRLGARAV